MDRNENTKKKTKHDVALFHEFFVLECEKRQMDKLTSQELNKFVSKFLITVQKNKDTEEYKLNSLRACVASFEHHWRKNYGLMKDVQALQSKQRLLKQKGKGNKVQCFCWFKWGRCSSSVWKRPLEKFHSRMLSNSNSPTTTIHFTLQGCKEHREMCWGDKKLPQERSTLNS